MILEPVSGQLARHPIPLNQVAETRARFGHLQICYEIDFEVDDAWRGLEACAKAFGCAGLTAIALRLTRTGTIYCKLADTRGTDLSALDEALADEPCIRIVGWTTVIEGVGQSQADHLRPLTSDRIWHGGRHAPDARQAG